MTRHATEILEQKLSDQHPSTDSSSSTRTHTFSISSSPTPMASPAILTLCLVGVIFSSSVTLATSSKVELALYYETLCPYCSNFMVNYLPTIFQNNLIDIINLKLVPYGNAKLGPNNTITCQHGPYECLLNTVEACALHACPDLRKVYTFIYCIERLVVDGKYLEWESCFSSTRFDLKPIEQCYKSGLGKQLDLQYAEETNNIDPPHTYVPWVTVNGQPLYEDYKNFTSYVCKAYKGNPVPKPVWNHLFRSQMGIAIK